MPDTPDTRDHAANRSSWVLHLVPPNGGGVDRFVRDLWTYRPQDLVLHVSPNQWVLEQPGHQFIALPPTALREHAHPGALGHPAWVHAHAVSATVREAALALTDRLRSPLAVTLHDITFTQGSAAEQAAALDTIRQARLVTAPSRYLCQVLADHLLAHNAPPLPCTLLPNGTNTAPAPASTLALPQAKGPFDIAVVGALGPHKGLQHLLDLCEVLPPGRRVVLIGYADGQLGAGWKLPDRLWIHGPFEPADLPALLQGYGTQLVFFPAGQAESFCYALSDVWQAGWPVLVPDQGALGERVRQHGQGQVYDPALSLAELALRVEHAMGATPPPTGHPEPTVAEMEARLDTLYRMTDTTVTAPPQVPDLQALAQTHLDSHFFRIELLRLQGDLEATRREAAVMRQELDALAHDHSSRGQWIQKLDGDVQQLEAALRTADAALRTATARPTRLQALRRCWNVLIGR